MDSSPPSGERGPDTSSADASGKLALPKVSVVLPSKDRPELLRRSVRTALDQVDVDVEVIVVDDGGRVPVADYLETDPRLRVVRLDTSQGVAEARNRGVAVASHDWIAFLDDDDIWAPHKLATQVAAMVAEDRRWSHTGTVRLNGNLELTEIAPPHPEDATYPSILQVNGVATPSVVVIDRALFADVGAFDPAFSIMADWDLWIRVSRVAEVSTVSEPLAGYVIHAGSMHRQNTKDSLRELRAIKAKFKDGPPVAGPYVWKWIAETHRLTGHWITCWPLYLLPLVRCPAGLWAARHRIVRGAIDYAARAVRLRPPHSQAEPPAWLREVGDSASRAPA